MNKILELVKSFEKLAKSAEPADIQRALGSLYTSDDAIYDVIDANVPSGKEAIYNIYMFVDKRGNVSLKVKGKPSAGVIQKGLTKLAGQMSNVLKKKKVFPLGDLQVPDVNEAWKKNIGYAKKKQTDPCAGTLPPQKGMKWVPDGKGGCKEVPK